MAGSGPISSRMAAIQPASAASRRLRAIGSGIGLAQQSFQPWRGACLAQREADRDTDRRLIAR